MPNLPCWFPKLAREACSSLLLFSISSRNLVESGGNLLQIQVTSSIRLNTSNRRLIQTSQSPSSALPDPYNPLPSKKAYATNAKTPDCRASPSRTHLLPARSISSSKEARNLENRSSTSRFSHLKASSSSDSRSLILFSSLSWSMRRTARSSVDAARAMLPSPCFCLFSLCQNVIFPSPMLLMVKV